MMNRSKRLSVQKYHDRVAPVYDHSYEDHYWQWHDSLTWDYLKPFLPRDLSREIVDLGCGTGKWAAKLVKSGYKVTCVDISARMLDQARAKIEPLGGSRRAEFVQADLADLSQLQERRFVLAVAFGEPVGCASHPAEALRQIRRIMANDGFLVATFDNRLAALDYYLERGDPNELARFLRDGRTHWLTKESEERFPITTYSAGDIRGLLESSGFVLTDLIGKTVLPMRHFRNLLELPEARRQWSKIEKSLSRDPDALGRAAHLQVVGRPS